ncbi:prepilin peptidase [Brevibacillus daliensis]|uniref:prepilin peptidase n=1 Tax=Brevibacillus daliensis TaxID=2892995 RepID=UPI001E34EAC1|nr:A24 family peptidase [Brevibacillus daliensis]
MTGQWERIGENGIVSIFIGVMIISVWSDSRERLIYDKVVLPALFLCFIGRYFFPDDQESFSSHLFGMAIAFILLYLTAVLTGGGIGGGDIKLSAFIGLVVGKQQIIWILLVANIVAVCWAILLWIGSRGKGKIEIPYACCLAVGSIHFLVDI